MKPQTPIYKFGEFRLDVSEKQLRRDSGEIVPIPPKAFELLLFLVENPNHLLEKNELMDNVWAGSFVEEGNLKIHVHNLRKVFNADGAEFIETIPRRGYRFNADVSVLEGDLVVEKITQSRLAIDGFESRGEPSNPSRRAKYLVAVLSLVVVALEKKGVWYWGRNRDAAQGIVTAAKRDTTIAVLPFRNLTQDPKDEFMVVGLTDAVTTRLGTIPRLTVRPTSSILRATSSTGDIGDIGERLKVDDLVEGTIQRFGDHLRITVQLVQTRDEKILWSRSFDEKDYSLLYIQDMIASNVAANLIQGLSDSERSSLTRPETNDAKAYELYLRGRHFWNMRTSVSLKQSNEFFDQSIKLDPNFALAYAGKADAYELLAEYGGMDAAEAFQKARESSREALRLNEGLAEAHTSLAYALAFYDRNWPEAEREFLRAIELKPNYPTAHQWYGEYLTIFGRFDEALAETRRAEDLDPTSPIIPTDCAAIFYLNRQYDRSAEETQKVFELDSNFAYGYAYRWIALEHSGRIPEAYEAIVKLDSLFYPESVVEAERNAFAAGGWDGLWRLKFSQTEKAPFDKLWTNYVKAMAAVRVGDTDKTLEFLRRSVEHRERWSVNLKFDPQWDAVRRDPRFAAIEQSLGF